MNGTEASNLPSKGMSLTDVVRLNNNVADGPFSGAMCSVVGGEY